MLEQIKKTIERFKMLEKGDKVLAAVSGGVDSIVLLHILIMLKNEYELDDVSVIHLNHSMRGCESNRDYLFVRDIAKKRNIRFIGKTVDVMKAVNRKNGSLQEIARKIRYDFFEDAIRRYKADKVATGHTLDDNAETVLMRIIKGTSLKGLSGIPPVRDKFIRPLIEIKRADIERYANENRLKFVEDSSNKMGKYLRNRLRLNLLPILQQYNPRIKEDLARLAISIGRDEDYLKRETEKIYRRILFEDDKNSQVFDLKKTKKLPDTLKARVFLKAIACIKGNQMGIYSYHIDDIFKLIFNHEPQCSINLPKGVVVKKEYDKLIFALGRQMGRGSIKGITGERLIKVPGSTYIKEIGKEIKASILEYSDIDVMSKDSKHIAYFDMAKLIFPLVVRNFKTGDRVKPFGMKGTKKIKDLFIEKKMPSSERKKTPILLSGDDIIWVVGVRRGEGAKIDKDTRRILMVVMVDLNPDLENQIRI
ncbi:MAG: tRNA lysidine(34) synthetase TilS [Deltaproteobacteria bacterium]|nr:tRNA lysidine(34) synthetase TilS [Deltaproteobacteria bacterium]